MARCWKFFAWIRHIISLKFLVATSSSSTNLLVRPVCGSSLKLKLVTEGNGPAVANPSKILALDW